MYVKDCASSSLKCQQKEGRFNTVLHYHLGALWEHSGYVLSEQTQGTFRDHLGKAFFCLTIYIANAFHDWAKQ